MCGIAGYFCSGINSGKRADHMHTALLPAILRNRGPDSHGEWRSPDRATYLFHSRLAILDLSPAGHQPMISRSGRLAITYNGEIYNFRSLAEELTAGGVELQGRSDTEVLLEHIDHFGLAKSLERAEGMFAFALADLPNQTLTLARDRLGEKPLYVYLHHGTLAFASDLRAINYMVEDIGPVDELALSQYFRYGYVPDPLAIYERARKLTPGSTLTVSTRPGATDCATSIQSLLARRCRPYWSIDTARAEAAARPIDSRDEALSATRSALQRVVAAQAIADVGVGVFLSGGIDSSLVAAMLSSATTEPVKSFTIAFEDPQFNEARFAAAIARHLGTEHHELTLTSSDLVNEVASLGAVYDEPFFNPSQIPSILLARHARQHVTVCLSGDGGDEAFGGYNRYFWGARVDSFTRHTPEPARYALSWALGRLSGLASTISKARLMLGRAPVQNLRQKLLRLSGAVRTEPGSELYDYLLSIWHAETMAVGAPPAPAGPDSLFDQFGFAEAAMLIDQRHYLPGDNFVKVDRASMSCSLETRLPLVNHKVLEISYRIPAELKWRDGQSKSILRDLLAESIPRALFERPKMGFSVPVSAWLRGPLREWAGDILHGQSLKSSFGIDPHSVFHLWRAHQTYSQDHGNELWAILAYLQWHAQKGYPLRQADG